MPIFNISTESCLGYTHYGDVTVNGKGTVELTDEQVQTIITLIRENGGETDIDALNLKESCPEIYDVLYEAFSDVAWKAAYNHWVIEGYDCNYYDTPLGESIAICEESYGFEYDGPEEKEDEKEEDVEEDDEDIDDEDIDDDKADAFFAWVEEYRKTLDEDEEAEFLAHAFCLEPEVDTPEFEVVIPEEIIKMSLESQ